MPAASATTPTVMNPQAEVLAGGYAEAMLGLVTNEQAEALAEEFGALVALVEGIDGFGDLWATAGPQKQAETVRRIFGDRCSPILEGLLAAMARHGRMGLLPVVADQFRRRLEVRQGHIEVTVVAAKELDAASRRLLIETLKKVTGADPLVQMQVDPSLVGGVVVRIGDREYDGSVAGALRQLRHRLKQVPATRKLPSQSGKQDDHEA
jgi:F-type H+-transporting ATPase subunit delta